MTSPAPLRNAAPLASAVKPHRLLLVDDSVVMRQLLTRMFADQPEFEVVGTARNGVDALAKISLLKPDVVTLDVEMPELDGIGTMRAIRKTFGSAVRVIMCSSLTSQGATATVDSLLAGADDYVTKPLSGQLSSSAYDTLRAHLRDRILALYGQLAPAAPKLVPSPVPVTAVVHRTMVRPQIIAIGVSTGGPAALAAILPTIPASCPVPIVIVQHMPPMFTAMLAQRLDKACQITVCEAAQGMQLTPGTALLAPGDFHLRVSRTSAGVQIALDQQEKENSCRPAVDVLFRSVAQTYGAAAMAIVLTGMGQDGLEGVRCMKALGASVLTQDRETSVVWGMPGAVVNAGLPDAVLPLDRIVPEMMVRL